MPSLAPESQALSEKKRRLVELLLEERAAKGAARPAAAAQIRRRADATESPLSFNQQRLWFLDRTQDTLAYNLPFVFDLEGALHPELMRRAFEQVIDRHAALRARFLEVAGKPVMKTAPDSEACFSLVDFTSLSPSEAVRAADELTGPEVRRAFDLENGPPIRVTLVALAPRRHRLIAVVHHIVFDGWSASVLFREIERLYEAGLHGKSADLAALPLQFGDFCAWQRSSLRDEKLEEQLRFWRDQLEGAPELSLPVPDCIRPGAASSRGGRIFCRIPAGTRHRLQELAQRRNASLFMVLFAAYQVLVSRYANQSDIVLGTAAAGRERGELQDIIGFFSNVLPIRGRIEDDATFDAVLEDVRRRVLEAYGRQDIPFEALLENLGVVRDPRRHPLFQVTFAFHRATKLDLEIEGVRCSRKDVETHAAKFDLNLEVFEAGDELDCMFEHSLDIFAPATIEKIAASYQALIESIAFSPGARVSELARLSEADRRILTEDWNRTERPYPRGESLAEHFERQAELHADATAAEFPDHSLTYRGLNERANRLARHLIALGVEPGERIGVAADRSAGMIVAILGIAKAGAAYLPLDSDYPAERLTMMLEDASVRYVVSTAQSECRIPRNRWQTIALDDRIVTGAIASNPEPRANGESVAYVMFTSGSTGRPKGIAVPHRAVMRLVVNTDYVHLGPGDRIAQASNASFDAATFEIWGALLNGGCVVGIEQNVALDVRKLPEMLRQRRITSMFLTTALFQQVAREQPDAFSSLRDLLYGGEACDPPLVARVLQHGPPQRLLHVYGPTESTTFATWHLVESVPENAARVPIGRPIANTTAYVLDQHGALLPPGAPGELYLGGDGIALGYVGGEDLTCERFIDSPFRDGERLYRTGDLVRRRADGEIEYLDRLDQQVKIRGFRIELAEIETALRGCEGVSDVVVVARTDEPGSPKRLAAYITAKGSSRLQLTDLRRRLGQILPGYMVPATFTLLDRIPLTPNGKVDRSLLPDPELPVEEKSEREITPRNEKERILYAAWAKVFRTDSVGIHQNFFDLGGDSIQGLQVIYESRQHGLRVTAKQIFLHQTIAELADVAEMESPEEAAADVTHGADIPLTPIQKWFFEHFSGRPHYFNQAVLLDVRERISEETVERALQALVRHHDALRLRFERRPNGWAQRIVAEDEQKLLLVFDLRGQSKAARQAVIAEHCNAIQAQLDIGAGPLLRAALFEHGDDEPQRLLLTIHHLAVDAVSWRFLLEDLNTLLTEPPQRGEVKLPRKTASFQRYAETLARHSSSDALDDELEHWSRVVSQRVASLPLGHGLPVHVVLDGMAERELDEDATRRLLQNTPAAFDADAEHVLLAALSDVLRRWRGGGAVAIDTESHGRSDLPEDLDVSRTVGWFTCCYPVVFEECPEDARAQIVEAKRRLAAAPRKGLGFGLLRYGGPVPRLGKQRSEILFNYLGRFDPESWASGRFELSKDEHGLDRAEGLHSPYLFEINCKVVAGRLLCSWLYCTAAHDTATIVRLAEAFLDRLRKWSREALEKPKPASRAEDFAAAQMSEGDFEALLASLPGSDS